MSDTGEGEKEKKVKPTLVRLGQSKPLGAGGMGTLPASSRATLQSLPNRSPFQSFKPKRDLTLGSSAVRPLEKKKFVPNLNVTRQIKKESDSVISKNNSLGKRKKENKHERRDKNSRDRPNLIQTDSIFSEGIGGDLAARRRAGGGYRDDSADTSNLVRPKLELGTVCDRAEEERKLKLILNDEFIDDLKQGNFLPIQLPMIETGSIFKNEVKSEIKDTDPDEDEIKPKKLNTKVSELDSDDDEEEREETKIKSVIDPEQVESNKIKSVSSILKQSDLIFFQLPDTLPLNQTSGNVEEGGSSNNRYTITGIEGQLGQMQIRKSGRAQIVFGQQRFDIESGTQVGFLQDLVSIRVPPNPESNGEMTVVGHVTNRLVLSPDWDSLLHSNGLNQDLA